MDRLKFTITAEHILNGEPDSYFCPVSLALIDQINPVLPDGYNLSGVSMNGPTVSIEILTGIRPHFSSYGKTFWESDGCGLYHLTFGCPTSDHLQWLMVKFDRNHHRLQGVKDVRPDQLADPSRQSIYIPGQLARLIYSTP